MDLFGKVKVVCNQLKDTVLELKPLALFFFAPKNTTFPNQEKERDIIKESAFLMEQEWNFKVKVFIIFHYKY